MPRVHARTIFLSFDADACFSNQLPASVPNPTHYLAHLELLTSTLHLGHLLNIGPTAREARICFGMATNAIRTYIFIYTPGARGVRFSGVATRPLFPPSRFYPGARSAQDD